MKGICFLTGAEIGGLYVVVIRFLGVDILLSRCTLLAVVSNTPPPHL